MIFPAYIPGQSARSPRNWIFCNRCGNIPLKKYRGEAHENHPNSPEFEKRNSRNTAIANACSENRNRACYDWRSYSTGMLLRISCIESAIVTPWEIAPNVSRIRWESTNGSRYLISSGMTKFRPRIRARTLLVDARAKAERVLIPWVNLVPT